MTEVKALQQNFLKWQERGHQLLARRAEAMRPVNCLDWEFIEWVAEVENYGEEGFTILDQLGITHKRYNELMTLRRAFPADLRDERLTISHYQEMLPLKAFPDLIRKLVSLAAEKNYTKLEVRHRVMQIKQKARELAEKNQKPREPDDVLTAPKPQQAGLEAVISDKRVSFDYQFERIFSKLIALQEAYTDIDVLGEIVKRWPYT